MFKIAINSINLGSPFLQISGSDSPKLVASHFGGGGSSSSFSPLTSAAAHHAFNLAAFRSPGFLGAHGFAFSATNIGNYREHSPSSFAEHHSPSSNHTANNNNTINSLNTAHQSYNTNSNSPNHQYSPARSSPRDGYLSSDYYHNNNTTTASAIKAAIESHHNSEYLSSERHHSNHSNNNSTSLNNNNNHISSNRHRNFDRATSESPEPQARSSPVDSSRSYSASQKSEEGDYHSPIHPDSIGSRSPENLSTSTASTTKKPNEMLDHHKLPLSFLGPPLAALHSMTNSAAAAANGVSVGSGNSGNNSIQQTQSSLSSHGAANPHGIDTILSRPPPVTSAGLNALSGMCMHFCLSSLLANEFDKKFQ